MSTSISTWYTHFFPTTICVIRLYTILMYTIRQLIWITESLRITQQSSLFMNNIIITLLEKYTRSEEDGGIKPQMRTNGLFLAYQAIQKLE